MSEAAAFQRWFVGAIKADRAPRQMPPSFAVYRNTWLKGLLDALDANYPTVAMILGADLFEMLSLQFARKHPAQSPILALYGAEFPDFLSRQKVSDDLPYLHDVAALERLWTECFFAPDRESLGPSRIAAVTAAEMLNLRVRVHPATRFGRFGTPAVTIWHAHRAKGDFDELEPEWRAEHALITRNGMSVAVQLIDEATHRLLEEIEARRAIDAAIAATAEAAPGTDLAIALATIIASSALAAPRAEDVRTW